MNIDNINIEKKIYKISVEYMESDFISSYDPPKSKILLYCEELKKYWYLNPRGGDYLDRPNVNSYTKGIYIFWFKHNEKYYPLEIGSGILSKRISIKYFKHTFDFPDLYVSFKRVDRDKLLKLERNYIEKLYPVLNKQYNNILSKKYLKNLKICLDYKTKQKALRNKAYKKDDEIIKREISNLEQILQKKEALKYAFENNL